MKKIILIMTVLISILLLVSGCTSLQKLQNATSNSTESTSVDKKSETDKSKDSNSNKDSSENKDINNSASDTTNGNSTSEVSTADGLKADSAATDNSIDTEKSEQGVSAQVAGTKNSNSVTKLTKKDIEKYSTMTKDSLIKTLGKDYKVQDKALVFSNGLSFYGLESNTSKPTMIKFNNKVEVMGIKNGMSFEKVQSVLGKTSVIKTYLDKKTNTVYKIQYVYGVDTVKVISPSKDGKDSFIEVCIK